MEEIDFEPAKPSIVLLVLCVPVFLLFSFGVFVSIRDLAFGLAPAWPRVTEAIVILALYLALLFFVGFYVLFGPRRFQFREDGMKVLTWRGRQFFPWKNASRAQLSVIRSGLFLQMRFGRWSYVMLRLMEFRKSVDLVREIERRLPVAVEGRNSAGASRILGG